jgi:hypothetical protein
MSEAIAILADQDTILQRLSERVSHHWTAFAYAAQRKDSDPRSMDKMPPVTGLWRLMGLS